MDEREKCSKCGRAVENIVVIRAHDAAVWCAECGLQDLIDPAEAPEYGGRVEEQQN